MGSKCEPFFFRERERVFLCNSLSSQVCWFTAAIRAFRWLRRRNHHKSEVSLGYIMNSSPT